MMNDVSGPAHRKTISLVVPCFNEEHALPFLAARLSSLADQLGWTVSGRDRPRRRQQCRQDMAADPRLCSDGRPCARRIGLVAKVP